MIGSAIMADFSPFKKAWKAAKSVGIDLLRLSFDNIMSKYGIRGGREGMENMIKVL